MSDYITAKEAVGALLLGENVERYYRGVWDDLTSDDSIDVIFTSERFRLKPKTITINGIEVPAPFEPNEGDGFWHISTENDNGYAWQHFENRKIDWQYIQFGAWRTEGEIKQVVAALRSVLKGN